MRGHSFLPCDRAFGLFKQSFFSICFQSDRLYTIDEYVNIISSSSGNPDKFKIVLIDSTMILGFQNWYQQYFIEQTNALQSCVGLSQRPEHFSISRYNYFERYPSDPMILQTSEYIDRFVSWYFKLRKPRKTGPISLLKKVVYTNKVPILETKINDL